MTPRGDLSSPAGYPPPVPHGPPGIDLASGLAAIYHSQLPTGEIPVFRRETGGGLSYCLCPQPSTLVHDALATFDPTASRFDRAAAVCIPQSQRYPALVAATTIRRRIRGFIAWQQQADAQWRFFGRGSGLGADAATTACAAAVLLEGRGTRPLPQWDDPVARSAPRWQRHVEALARYRNPDGTYRTSLDNDPEQTDAAAAITGREKDPDRTVNAHVLRFLALAGEPVGPLAAYLKAEAKAIVIADPPPDHTNPLCFPHALARAWHEPALPDREDLARKLIPEILDLQNNDGDFGAPLSTSLAILTLLDLGCTDQRLRQAGAVLCQHARSHGTWGYEHYQGNGSASLTTAFCLAALGRLLALFRDLEEDL